MADLSIVARIMEDYPAFTPYLQIPEIASILIEASTPGAQWNVDKLRAKIEGTHWWKNNSDSQRVWQITKLVSPASAAEKQAAVATDVMHAAANAGIVLDPGQVAWLSTAAAEHSWTAAQLQEHVGAQANNGTLHAGTIRSTQTQLQGIAQSYGVPLSEQTAFAWSKRINEGLASSDGFTAYAQEQAKLHYPTLAKHIDQGMTVRQLADPYLQIAGQTLGIDPNAADLSQPKWQAALQHRDEKGNIVGPLTHLDWQRKLMTDPTYGYDHTAQAQTEATNLVEQLGSAFGVIK